MDIIHRPSLIKNFNWKHDVSKTRVSLRHQVKSTCWAQSIELVSGYVDYSIDWVQQSRFYLKMEPDSSLWNVVFLVTVF